MNTTARKLFATGLALSATFGLTSCATKPHNITLDCGHPETTQQKINDQFAAGSRTVNDLPFATPTKAHQPETLRGLGQNSRDVFYGLLRNITPQNNGMHLDFYFDGVSNETRGYFKIKGDVFNDSGPKLFNKSFEVCAPWPLVIQNHQIAVSFPYKPEEFPQIGTWYVVFVGYDGHFKELIPLEASSTDGYADPAKVLLRPPKSSPLYSEVNGMKLSKMINIVQHPELAPPQITSTTSVTTSQSTTTQHRAAGPVGIELPVLSR